MLRFLSRRPEIALVGAFGLLALTLLAILKLASEIAEGDMIVLDTRVLIGMRQLTGNDGPAVFLLRAITFLGNTATLVVVTALSCLVLVRMHDVRRAAILVAGIAIGMGSVSLLKQWVDRARPDIVAHLTGFSQASFPSGHAANAAIVYLAVAALLAQAMRGRRRRIAILTGALALVIAIGLSRLFLGVHWPTDVLAGWIFGAAWALLCWTVSWWHDGRRKEVRS